jgi:peptide/nickel transport system permease protein
MFGLGFPIGLQFLLEWGVFGTVMLLMGRLGTVPVAAHQIAINVASLTFMVPLGLSFLALAVRTGWFPAGGMVSAGFEDFSKWQQVRDLLWHLVLPVAALTLGSLPVLLRHVRAALLAVLDSSFIRAASGYGIPRRRILWFHALPAAINPLVSLFGLSLAALLSISLLAEVIMSWPGLGPFLLEAVLAHDVYVVVGAVTFSTFFLLAGTALADLLLFAADPRIRTEALI